MKLTSRRTVPVLTVALALVAAVSPPLARAEPSGSPGQPDRSFGEDGRVMFDLPGDDYVLDAAVQPDGKLVLAGAASDAVALVRLDPRGRRDPSFGRQGVTLLDFGAHELARRVELAPDGSIVVVGWAQTRSHTSRVQAVDDVANVALDRWVLVVARFTAAGRLDRSFGDGGVFRSPAGDLRPLDDFGVDVALRPDGSIVVLAVSGVQGTGSAVLLQLTADGALDPTFGVGGRIPAGPPGIAPSPAGLAVDRDGSVVVASTWWEPGFAPLVPPSTDVVVSRFTSTGMPDTGFGLGGVVREDLGGGMDDVESVYIDRRGRIVLVGDTTDGLDLRQGTSQQFQNGLFVLRLQPDGRRDDAYGNRGLVEVRTPGAIFAWADATALPADGRLLIAKYTMDQQGGVWTGLQRLERDGRVDRTFSPPHGAPIALGTAGAVVVDRGRIFVAGVDDRAYLGFGVVAFTR